MKPNHDFHVHTYLSSCCSQKEAQTPAAIISLAEEMGIDTVGFSDHVWENHHLTPSDWYQPQDERQIEHLRADLAVISTRIRVLVGCEADTIAPGKFSITPEFAQGLDFVLLACSHFHMFGFVEQPESNRPKDLARHMLKFFLSAVTSGFATSIPHPLLPLGHLENFDAAIASISDGELFDVFGLANEHGVGLEITTGFLPPESQPPFSIETPIRYLSLAKEVGCKFSLGTDAHSPVDQKRLPELVRITDALNLKDNDILPLLRQANSS